tara:strand:- start:1105 stop:1317 length:213 start_codon:yes stop_codon:yes gene_type:complete
VGGFSKWKSTDAAKSPSELTRKERDTERGNVLVQSRSKLQQPFLVCVVVFLAKRKKNTPSRRGIIIIDDE